MSSAYFKNGSLVESFTSTATSAGTLTLTNSSDAYQIFTGSTTHTMKLPDATTMILNQRFEVINLSSAAITVQNNSSVTQGTVAAGASMIFRVTDISSAAGIFDVTTSPSAGGGGLSTAESSEFNALAANGFSATSKLLKYNPEEIGGNFWTAKLALPLANYSAQPFTLNGFVYNSGGNVNGGGYSSSVYRYTYDSNYWLLMSSTMPDNKGVGMNFSFTKGYAVSGQKQGSGVQTTVFAFNDGTSTWSTATAVPVATDSAASFALNGYGYFSGGEALAGTGTNATYAYNETNNAWYIRQPTPTSAANSIAQFGDALNGFGYCVGGGDNADANLQTTANKYDPSSNSWKLAASLSTARQWPFTAATVGSLVVGGGYNGGAIATVEQFFDAPGIFLTRASMITARIQTPGASINGYPLAIGGDLVTPVETYTAFSMFMTGSLKKSITTPTTISVLALLNNIAQIAPVQLRTDGINWKSFMSESSPLNLNETTANKFQPTGLVYIVGGSDSTGTTFYTISEGYDDQANVWRSKGSLNTGVAFNQHFNNNGLGYTMGGWIGSAVQNTQAYNDITQSTANKTNMTIANAAGASFGLNNFGYAIAGLGNTTASQQYNPTLNTWASVLAYPISINEGPAGFVIYGFGYVSCGSPSGVNSGVATSYRYSDSANTWTLITAANRNCTLPASFVGNGFGYLVGGYSVGFAETQQYNPISNSWATLASVNNDSYGSGTGVINGYAYKVSGQNLSGPITNAEKYNFYTNAWSNVASVTTPRQGLGSSYQPGSYYNYEVRVGIPAFYAGLGGGVWVNRVAFNNPNSKGSHPGDAVSGYGYSLGGYDANTGTPTYATTERYDDILNTSTRQPTMGTTRANCAAFSLQGSLYATAGDTQETPSYTVSLTGEVLNLATSVWTALPNNAATAVGYVFGGKLNGLGYKVGGRTAGLAYQSLNEQFNPSTVAWSTKTSMITARANSGNAFSPDGFLYVIGGFISGTTYSLIEQYNDVSNAWASKTNMNTVRQAYYGGIVSGNIMIAAATSEMYLPALNLWAVKATVASADSSGANATISNNVIKIGGASLTNTIERYTDSVKQAVLSAGITVS